MKYWLLSPSKGAFTLELQCLWSKVRHENALNIRPFSTAFVKLCSRCHADSQASSRENLSTAYKDKI